MDFQTSTIDVFHDAIRIDAEGDVKIPYRLTVGNDAASSASTIVAAKGEFDAMSAKGVNIAINNASSSGTVTGIKAVVEAPVDANDVIVTGIEGRGVKVGRPPADAVHGA